jgi:hypothetical protein
LVAIDREIDDAKPPKTEASGSISCDEIIAVSTGPWTGRPSKRNSPQMPHT